LHTDLPHKLAIEGLPIAIIYLRASCSLIIIKMCCNDNGGFEDGDGLSLKDKKIFEIASLSLQQLEVFDFIVRL